MRAARAILAAACLLLGAGGARAGEAGAAQEEEAQRVREVEVEAEAPAAPPAPESAQRRDPTGALSVLEVEAQRAEAKDTAEVLAGAPGLSVQDTGGWGQRKSLVVRGASANGVLVLLDGVPLNGAGGIADLSRIPLALVERFEVLRGGAGARYGTGGLGGVINVVSRSPRGGVRATAELTHGSFGTWSGGLAATGALGGGQGLLALHAGRSEGDFAFLFDPAPSLPDNPLEPRERRNNDARGGGLLLKYRHPLGRTTTLDALGELFLDERGLAGTAHNPTPALRQSSGRGTLALALERALAPGASVRARAFGRRDRVALSGTLPDGAQVDASTGLEVDGQALVGGAHVLSASLQAGLEWLEGAGDARPRWGRGAVMVMDEWLLADGTLTLAPSLRLERVGPFTLFSPKLGVALALPHGLEVRANAGQSHRAPSFLELYVRQGVQLHNPDLRPERALYLDAALTHRRGRRWASVGPFVALYEDLIAYELYPPLAARPVNFASARVWGLEAEGGAEPVEGLSLVTSYTLLFSRNLRDDPRFFGRELPYRPRHKLSARLGAGPRWLRGHLEALVQSRQFVNRTENVALAGRAFLHAGLATRVGREPGVTLALELKNVLDARAEDYDGYPLPGRALYLTVGAALGREEEAR